MHGSWPWPFIPLIQPQALTTVPDSHHEAIQGPFTAKSGLQAFHTELDQLEKTGSWVTWQATDTSSNPTWPLGPSTEA